MIFCTPVCDWNLTNSDNIKKDLQEFVCPYTKADITALKRDMEELEAWDERYFKHREELLKELDELVKSVVDIGSHNE